MFQGVADQILGRTGSARVQTVFASDVRQLQELVLGGLRERTDSPSVVSITWDEAPGLENELEAAVEALAEAARSIWPRWYSSPIARFEQRDETPPDLAKVISRAKHQALPFSETWTKRVWERCAKNKLPISKKIVAAEQIRQLALAIDPHHLYLVVAVLGAATRTGRLQTLAKALEWMAAQAGAPLIFLAPAEWSDRAELDAINFSAIDADALDQGTLAPREEQAIEDSPIVTEKTTTPSADESGVIPTPRPSAQDKKQPVASSAERTAGVVVEPFFGKPHPSSPVENYLAEYLAADSELSPLFRWNHPIRILGPSCSVDLLWEEGRLVIELDGPSHWKQLQYSKDRTRDYLLLLEGYTTLRVTNESVVSHVELVIEQIRKVVHHQRAKGIVKNHGTESQTGASTLAHAHG